MITSQKYNYLKPEFRQFKQTIFDLKTNSTTKSLINWDVKGKTYKVYSNVNLSIYSGQECNGNCSFCVEQLRPLSRGRSLESQKTIISDDKEYFKLLEKTLNATKQLNPSISITGGEPSKDIRLCSILDCIINSNMRKRTMTTNGSGLLDVNNETNLQVIDLLVHAKLSHLNLSRAHYNENINHQIMDLDEFFSNEKLREIVIRAKMGGIRPRLSCVLLSGYVDNIQEIVKYLDWAASMGVENVVFRQLMQFDHKTHLKNRITQFCQDYFVPLVPLLQEIYQNEYNYHPDFKFIKQVMGYYYYVEVFHYRKPRNRGIDVVFEEADLSFIELRKQTDLKKNIIYELIFHPNGHLCSTWQPWDGLIL
ncbi:MAG: 4Fe-4S cluster-binding domain-containing protein [Candidatus Helarchaeota archaeon]|nr:4Fe-4S cluster-binding domain-containing protein [Candidatus Helarchaeota archaeon]